MQVVTVKNNVNSPIGEYQMRQEASLPIDTNSIGRASIMPTRTLSDTAYIEAIGHGESLGLTAIVNINQAFDHTLQFVLVKAYTIQGRVTLNGEPIAGAKLSIRKLFEKLANHGYRGGSYSLNDSIQAESDASGEFQAHVPRGFDYNVVLESVPGLKLPAMNNLSVTETASGELPNVNFNFKQHAAKAIGIVVDEQGKPIVGATVQLGYNKLSESQSWIGFMSVSNTNAEGQFEMTNMPTGTYEVLVDRPSANATAQAVQGFARVPNRAYLRLQRAT